VKREFCVKGFLRTGGSGREAIVKCGAADKTMERRMRESGFLGEKGREEDFFFSSFCCTLVVWLQQEVNDMLLL
jgi:hypothetical protein